MVSAGFHEKRDRLVALLGEAAELEHAVCCQYLFAAFSMRTHPDEGHCTWAQVELIRRWRGTMLSIARMEMEHLGIVANLLTAVGEAPWFRRHNFPTAKAYYPLGFATTLEAFNATSLARFVLFELPDPVDDTERSLLAYLDGSPLPEDAHLADQLRNARSLETHGLVAMYDEIASLIQDLGSTDAAALLVGPPEAQIGNASVFPTFPPVPDNVRNYDVLVSTVTDLASALAAVDQIREEGEGSKSAALPEGGHFERFAAMYRELSEARRADADFIPGRPVVPNPVAPKPALPTDPELGNVTVVTHPASIEALQIYDLAYDVTLRMLTRLFARTGHGSNEVSALQNTVFFPMMTLVLRPFGDVITQMPAFEDAGRPERAGPAFRLRRDADLLPHPEAAWRVLHGQLMEASERADALSKRPDVAPALAERIEFMSQNLWRMAYNFAEQTGLEVTA